ncbi:MAG: OmpA family protein [Sulfitobacter sp.]
MIRAVAVLSLLLVGPALALEISLPTTARQTVTRNTGPDTYAAPIGVFDQGRVPSQTIEGNVARSAWRIESPGLTAFQVMRPLREQLVDAGYDVILDCEAEACGGFDFRFATETLPGPHMYVNIRSFHFVTGRRTKENGTDEVVTLLASTAASSAYVQVIHAGDGAEQTTSVSRTAPAPSAPQLQPTTDLAASLLAQGHILLDDLDFETGSTNLGAGPFESLAQLAAFLKAEPDMRVALVGHTDTDGGLQGNITISRRRAAAVRQRLIDTFDIPAAQMDAEGMGYLAPVASNLEPEGRDANRRVEVVLLGPR